MMVKTFQPWIRGSGNAGHAISKAISILRTLDRKYTILEPKWLGRDEKLACITSGETGSVTPLLLLAHPHGLHAQTLLEAIDVGITYIICEKPICVSLQELEQLESLPGHVGVFHGYRQLWGPQTIRQMIDTGELGELVSVEGHYLQSSATQLGRPTTWKDDPRLSGEADVLLDLASHWVDLSHFLNADFRGKATIQRLYPHASSPHRDTHVHLSLEYASGARGLASISKVFHGAGNDLTVHALGTKARCSWSFANPDQVSFAQQKTTKIINRAGKDTADLPPFHGMGWLEGYAAVLDAYLSGSPNYPTAQEGKATIRTLLDTPKG